MGISKDTDISKKKNKKKRNKKVKNDGASAENTTTSEEGALRKMQREMQQLVLRLRGEGKNEQVIAAAKRELKRKLTPAIDVEGTAALSKKKQAWLDKVKTE